MSKRHLHQTRIVDCEFPTRLTNLLLANGYETLADLNNVDRDNLRAIKGLGTRSMWEIVDMINAVLNRPRDAVR